MVASGEGGLEGDTTKWGAASDADTSSMMVSFDAAAGVIAASSRRSFAAVPVRLDHPSDEKKDGLGDNVVRRTRSVGRETSSSYSSSSSSSRTGGDLNGDDVFAASPDAISTYESYVTACADLLVGQGGSGAALAPLLGVVPAEPTKTSAQLSNERDEGLVGLGLSLGLDIDWDLSLIHI